MGSDPGTVYWQMFSDAYRPTIIIYHARNGSSYLKQYNQSKFERISSKYKTTECDNSYVGCFKLVTKQLQKEVFRV